MNYIFGLRTSVAEGTLKVVAYCNRFCYVLKEQNASSRCLPQHLFVVDSTAPRRSLSRLSMRLRRHNDQFPLRDLI